MFQLADENEIFEYPGTVRVPAGGGFSNEQTFTAKFRLVPASELKAMQSGSDVEFFKRVLAGWDGIQNAAGKPLSFNATNLERLADIGYFAVAVGQAYSSFAMGLPAKNSAPPRGP